MPVLGLHHEDTVKFPDNHYALLQSAAKQSPKQDITDNYLSVNSYSTK
jgi:hypothetical protein